MIYETDVLIIGSGIAGCSAALELAKGGMQVTLLSSNAFDQANSYRAQGGIGYQSPDEKKGQFKGDILRAGDGLCFEKAVDQLVTLGPSTVRELLIEELSVPFARSQEGQLLLTREAAHSTSRILFHEDRTGGAIMQVLHEKIQQHPKITLKPKHNAVDLITLSHHSKRVTDVYAHPTCVGAYVLDAEKGIVDTYFAKETILASGGADEVFLHTTNSKEARGDGIAMAYRAGVRIMNMEYIQFHPTALYRMGVPRFLLSEALRGEGGQILDHTLKPFMHKLHPDGDLAPRDIVARGIFKEMIASHRPHLWLDIRSKKAEELKSRFPFIYRTCQKSGFDLATELLPIVPAAHYSCGGIAVDLEGKTTMLRLRAIGEVACSGVHGANRLAGAALLEGIVWAKTCATSILKSWEKKQTSYPEIEPWQMGAQQIDEALIQQDWTTIKQTMWNYVGLIRSPHRLKRAFTMLSQLKWEIDSFYENATLTSELLGLRNGCETALLIAQGALRNPHSRGCHYREDTLA